MSKPPESVRAGFPARVPGIGASTGKPRAVSPVTRGAAPAKPQPVSGVGLESAAVRERMVARLRRDETLLPAVLAAFAQVPRHLFVDTALVQQAYEDTSLPIGLGQTISKPSVVARMLSLGLQGRVLPLPRVLEVGTGCGYQAALISLLAREVYSIERLKGLHEKARANLRSLRLANLHLLYGDGRLGHPVVPGYDLILAAAGGDDIPQAWMDQLADGGRIVAPTSMGRGAAQTLVVVERQGARLVQQAYESVQFVPLKSGAS